MIGIILIKIVKLPAISIANFFACNFAFANYILMAYAVRLNVHPWSETFSIL